MSAQSDKETTNKRHADETLSSRGLLVATAAQRVFLTTRRLASRDIDERGMKENGADCAPVASGSTPRKRKHLLRDKAERPDSPVPERHPPRSTLHQPFAQRLRPNKMSALGKSRASESNHSLSPDHHRRTQSYNAALVSTDDDRHSRPQFRPDFTIVRERRSPSQASTLYERLSRYSSDSLDEIEDLHEQIVKLKKVR
jgi:hypothetical protein